ncbi:Gramicidin S synthase 1 [compost metagenome]
MEYTGNALTILNQPTGNDIDSRNSLTCLIDIQCFRFDQQLHIEFKYHENELDKDWMRNLLDCYKSVLESVINYGCTTRVIEFTPSDFSGIHILQEELDGILD